MRKTHKYIVSNQEDELLRESEEILSITLNSIGDAVIATDEKGSIVRMNPVAEKLCGWSFAEAKGKRLEDVFRIINSETREPVVDPVRMVMDTGKVVGLANHTALISRDGSEYQISDSAAPIKNSEGEIFGVILIFSDISEDYALRKKIKESEHQYRSLFSSNNDGVCVHEIIYKNNKAVDYRIIDVNPKYESIIGISRSKAIGALGSELYDTGEPPYLNTYADVAKTGNPTSFETYFPSLSKHFFISVYSPEHGKFATVFQDITERKNTEDSLLQEKMFTEAILDSMPGFFYVYDEAGNLVRWNKKHEEMTGYTAEELSHMSLDKWYEGEDAINVASTVEEVFKTGYGEVEANLLIKGGGKLLVRSNGVRLTLGGKTYFTGVGVDITAQKKAEAEIIESQKYFEEMFNTSPDAALITRLSDGLIVNVNEGFTNLSWFTRNEAIGKSVLGLEFYKNPTERKKVVKELIEKGYLNNLEVDFRRKDGVIFTSLMSAKRIMLNGVPHISSNIRDISDRKLMEDVLRKSEGKYRYLVVNSHDIVYTLTPGGLFDFVSPAWTALLGHPLDQVVGQPFQQFVHPEDVTKCMAFMMKVIESGQPQSGVEYRVHHVDGTWRWHTSSAAPMKDDVGNVIAYEGVARDITDRKRAEKELAHSHDLMRYMIEYNRSGIAIYNRDLNYLYVSQRFLDDFKVKDKDVIGKNHYDVFPDLPQKLRDVHQKALAGEILSAEDDPYVREDGTVEWTRWECRPWYEADGSIGGIIIYSEVITDRKNAELSLRASEERYKSIFNQSPIGIALVDSLTRRFYSVNQKFAEISGRTIEELYDIDWKDITYTDDLQNDLDNMALLNAGKIKSFNMDKRYVKPDDSIVWINMTISPIKVEGVNPCHICMIIDITDKKEKEEKIKYLNYHDVLTGIYNRAFFEEEIDRLDTECQLPLSTITGDINGLKFINDTLGHAEGDRLLVEMAKILKKCSRKEDIVARIGGDEFSILMPKTNSEEAHAILDKIYTECKDYKINRDKDSIFCSIALGYATKNTTAESFVNITKIAEDNMYRRKLLAHKSFHSSLMSSIKATLFEKSHETEEHAERLVGLSRELGKALKLAEEQLSELELLSTLHDIGKISIDDSILTKPGKLIDEEWQEIKRHPGIGCRIAMASPEPVPIADYILCHHERWDGKGYPQGLSEKSIPLLSRILAVVDAYDAMTSDRPYRKAMSIEQAMIEIENNAGTQFDPEITKIFIESVLGKGN